MITAGIDCGAKNTKAVILRDQEVIGQDLVRTGFDQEKSAAESLEKAIKAAGIARDEIQRICSTGSGKKAVKFADDDVDDITAMSRGAIFFFPDARTVVDVGAEEGRAAKIDAKGNPVDFEINDNCAAGAGAFIEAMSRALGVSIEEMGPLALQSDKKIPMNAQCVVFAESEVVGLIHTKTARQDISRAIHDAMAGRIVSLVRRIGINQDVAMVGGVGYNPGIRAAMLHELKVENLYVPADPEFGSAVGAAVVAAEKAECQ